MTYKLAIITDVHADVQALWDALKQIERLGCNQIVCAGDLIDWGLFPEETLAILREKRITCIRGNHDRWAVTTGRDQGGYQLSAKAIGFLETLPTHWRWIFEGVRVLMWHARPGSDMKGIYRDTTQAELSEMVNRANADVLIVGHTHEPFRRRLPGGRWVVNPGALLRDPDQREAGLFAPGTFGLLELPSKGFTVYRAGDGVEVALGQV